MNDISAKGRKKQRVALIGLGMAVTPHARALRDLSDRVEIIHAYSPTAARREAFGKDFDFPLTEQLETILEDRSVEATSLFAELLGVIRQRVSQLATAARLGFPKPEATLGGRRVWRRR